MGGSLGDLNAANRHVYAGDDPVNATDPSGKDAIDCYLEVTLVLSLAITVIAGMGAILFAVPPLAGLALVFAWLTVGAAFVGFVVSEIQAIRSGVCKGYFAPWS